MIDELHPLCRPHPALEWLAQNTTHAVPVFCRFVVGPAAAAAEASAAFRDAAAPALRARAASITSEISTIRRSFKDSSAATPMATAYVPS
mmetsp:Transcript_14427/g.42601  ORF Transcript_14427/g.42601 Transcript_14427/m.42601 type:complete len:90 (-) Transcript_14427:1136-1405(-)